MRRPEAVSDSTSSAASDTCERERLRQQFVKRLGATRAAALAAGGEVPEQEVTSLERLHRLLHLEAPAPRTRRPMLVLVAVVLTVASVLLFARVSSTDIELRAAASELRFTNTAAMPLTPVLRLQSVAVAGAKRVEGLPRPGGLGGDTTGEGTAVAFRLGVRSAATPASGGSVTLEPISVPANARLELEPVEGGTALRLSVTSAGLVLRISTSGPLDLERGGRSAEAWTAGTPQADRKTHV